MEREFSKFQSRKSKESMRSFLRLILEASNAINTMEMVNTHILMALSMRESGSKVKSMDREDSSMLTLVRMSLSCMRGNLRMMKLKLVLLNRINIKYISK